MCELGGNDEVKGAEDAHTHYHTDVGTSDFMSTAAAALTTPLSGAGP